MIDNTLTSLISLTDLQTEVKHAFELVKLKTCRRGNIFCYQVTT